jgi:hypothetical protein
MPDLALQWIDPSGTVQALRAGPDAVTQEGRQGRFSPPPLFELERVPLQPGQRFRNIVHGPTIVHVPVALRAGPSYNLRTAIRNWAHLLDPTRGDGTLRVIGPAGDTRDLVCRYVGGLDNIVEDDWSDLSEKALVVLNFTTEQPYWQDPSDTVTSWQLLSSLATFFPLFPLRLSGSEIFADTTVDNSLSDVESWPVWTITGPGSSPILRNLTKNVFLSLPVTLLAGESVVIDTRPGHKTVTKQDGSSLFGSLTQTSSLWSLLPASNSVRIELTGALAGVSTVGLNFRRRYLSA